MVLILIYAEKSKKPSNKETIESDFFGFFRIFFSSFKKVIYFSGLAFSPPPLPPLLVARPLKKITFFAASLTPARSRHLVFFRILVNFASNA